MLDEALKAARDGVAQSDADLFEELRIHYSLDHYHRGSEMLIRFMYALPAK
jgi:hypothetical protein